MIQKKPKYFKRILEIVILIIVFILNLQFLLSQPSCEVLANNSVPPSAFSNSYMQFDGKGDFLRSQNHEPLNLNYSQTNSFTITSRIKVNNPFTSMKIFGKYYGSGWILSYNDFSNGVISFTISGTTKNVYTLNADTNWHTYKISFSKSLSLLVTEVDGTVTNTYTNFSYGATDNSAAFAIGNTGFPSTYGWGSYSLAGNWFKGGIDFLKIERNNFTLARYDFGEGAGQVVRDSASYYIGDRIYPGVSGCGILHMMLGYMPASDTCDPVWISADTLSQQTGFFPLGSGLSYYYDVEGLSTYLESSSSGLTVWNGKLVNCGKFNRADGNEIKSVGLWDGSGWSPAGNGFNSDPMCAAVYNGELYVGGYFDSAYGFCKTNHIARWDGQQWKNLGNGTGDLVNAMYEFNGDLIVGGFFMSVDEMYAPKIAKWNGSQWSAMGSGFNGPVYSICSYKGELYAAGNFAYSGATLCNGIAKWNGADWEPVGNGVHGNSSTIFSLCVFQNELWAAGSFTIMNTKVAKNIAKYNGKRWEGLYPGADGLVCPNNGAYVTGMQEYNNSLYVIGMFTNIGGTNANKIACFSGSAWCPVEYGTDLRPKNLTVYNNDLIINGDFYSISGKVFGNIAGYNPEKKSLKIESYNKPKSEKFSLNQNYPNPFNPSTEIKFECPSPGNVSLIVYNLAGQQVAELVNSYMTGGMHSVKFDGTNLASGVYFYKLISASSTDIKKMVLIK